MKLKNKLFSNREKPPVELPAILQPDNPVRYETVLDYLVGLPQRDFDKLIKVTGIYREANKSAARVLGVKDQPTSTLADIKQSEESIDNDLDQLLETPPRVLTDMLNSDMPAQPELKKSQSPSKETKININEE